VVWEGIEGGTNVERSGPKPINKNINKNMIITNKVSVWERCNDPEHFLFHILGWKCRSCEVEKLDCGCSKMGKVGEDYFVQEGVSYCAEHQSKYKE